MADDHDDFDEPAPRPSRLPIVLLPLATAFVATAVGLAIGSAATALVFGLWPEPEREVVEVRRDLSDAEIQAICSPFVTEATNLVEEAQQKVQGLEAKVVAKEQHVKELEDEMARRGKRGAELVRQLETAKKELVTLQEQLTVAVQEKEQLVVELQQTKTELADQKVKTEIAKEDALDFKWRDFMGTAQLEMCERGNRKKLAGCREKVAALMGPALEKKFAHCVRSGQAVPSVREIGKDERLPQFAEWLDEDDKITKGWYVLLCDPTLPEAEGEGVVRTPSEPREGGSTSFDEFDLPAFDDLDE